MKLVMVAARRFGVSWGLPGRDSAHAQKAMDVRAVPSNKMPRLLGRVRYVLQPRWSWVLSWKLWKRGLRWSRRGVQREREGRRFEEDTVVCG